MQVKVTVTIRGRTLPLEEIKDSRISAPFRSMALEIGTKLEGIRCPEHGQAATDVRIHVDARGAADLKYESCCPKLGALIGKALQ